MLLTEKNISKKKNTLIFIFIQKITAKNMQDLIFFFQKNDFHLKRITKKNKKHGLTSIFVNSNFILESEQNIRSQQLKNLILFLNPLAQIHGIFFQNQILNLQRNNLLANPSLLILWKRIKNWIF